MDESKHSEDEEVISFDRLPNLEAIKAAAKRTGDTCGDCGFYVCNPGDFKAGTCFANPPGVAMGPRGPVAIRPGVTVNDAACRFFKGAK